MVKSFSLSKRERITHKHDFKSVFFNHNLIIPCHFFEIRILEKSSGLQRMGVVLSKKVGSSVVRNKIKRICREWFRTHKFYFNKPLDIVFFFRNKLTLQQTQSLIKTIENKLSHFLKKP